MSVSQYLRKVSLKFLSNNEEFDLSPLQFKFQITMGDIQTPNSADIRIYNVSELTASRIDKEFKRVVLQAGYEGNFGTIFKGNIKQIRRGRESSTDTYIDVTAADGDAAYNFAVVNQSLGAGSTPADQLSTIQTAMSKFNVSQGYQAPLPKRSLPRGKVMFGMARDCARTLANSTDMDWSLQNEQLTLIPQQAYIPGEIPVITSDTGMVGLPEQTQDGIKVKCLLNPYLTIGRAVKIDNKSVQQIRFGLSINAFKTNAFIPSIRNDGTYRILVVDHQGDTRGQEYYTLLTCVRMIQTVGQAQRLSVPGGV